MKRHRRRLINRNLIPESPEKRAERRDGEMGRKEQMRKQEKII